MIGKVVRGGRIYSEPGDGGCTVGTLTDGQCVRVDGPVREGRWISIHANGVQGYTKSYRVALRDVRCDEQYGYGGWGHKTDIRDETPENYSMKRYEEPEDQDVKCDTSPEPVVVEIERGPASEAEILNAGVLGISTIPGDSGAKGFLEPGGGTLQLIDRWLTSRERRAALKANSAGKTVPISQARYGLLTTITRCATFGLAAYGAAEIALRFVN